MADSFDEVLGVFDGVRDPSNLRRVIGVLGDDLGNLEQVHKPLVLEDLHALLVHDQNAVNRAVHLCLKKRRLPPQLLFRPLVVEHFDMKRVVALLQLAGAPGNHLFELRAGAFLVFNIGACADPLHNLPLFVAPRRSTSKKPTVSSVRSALETVFDLVVFPRGERMCPAFDAGLEVLWMHDRSPAPVFRLFEGEAGVIEPHPVVIIDAAIRPRGPDDQWHGVGQEAVALGACAHEGGDFGLLQFLLDPASLRDVLGHDDDPDHLPVLVAVGYFVRLNPQLPAVRRSNGFDSPQFGRSRANDFQIIRVQPSRIQWQNFES